MIANRLAPHRPFEAADGTASDDIWRPSSLPLAVRYLAALAMTALAAVVAVGVDARVAIPNLSLLFVLPVIVAALAFGLGSSLLSAVLGALAYNYFLTEPRYTLQVDDPANIWAIALLFVVGVIASGVASTARRWANEAAHLRRQGVLLRSYLGKVNAAGGPEAIAAVSADALAALFGAIDQETRPSRRRAKVGKHNTAVIPAKRACERRAGSHSVTFEMFRNGSRLSPPALRARGSGRDDAGFIAGGP